MAVTFTKPSELDAATTVTGTAAIIVDNGTTVEKATPKQVVDAGRPVSSEAQAVAGTDNETTMTPLTVRQALDADTSGAVAKAQAWAESDTAPGDPGTKSAKTWAGEAAGDATAAAESAAKAELFDGPKFNTIALMALYEDAKAGDVATVLSAFNGGVEHFDWIEGGSLTADGALVVDGVGGQWVSKRTVYADWAERKADPRTFPDNTVATVIGLAGQYVATSGAGVAVLENDGGQAFDFVSDSLFVSPKSFGCVPDTTISIGGTDNTAAMQACWDFAKGRLIVDLKSPDGFGYGVTKVLLNEAQKLVGNGKINPCLIGLSADNTVENKAGERYQNLNGVFVYNGNGGWAGWFDDASEMTLHDTRWQAAGVPRKGGARFRTCYRMEWSGGNKFSGWPGIQVGRDCNGCNLGVVIASGGAGTPTVDDKYAGVAAILGGFTAVKIQLVVETSRTGFILAANEGDPNTVGDLAYELGNTRSLDMSNSYFENTSKIGVAGIEFTTGQSGFKVFSLNMDGFRIGNTNLNDDDPFDAADHAITLGRVETWSMKRGALFGSGDVGEALIKLAYVAANVDYPRYGEARLDQLTGYSQAIDYSEMLAASGGQTSQLAAYNRIITDKNGDGLGVPFEFESIEYVCNAVTTGSLYMAGDWPAGGRITKVEIFGVNATALTGLRIRVGYTGDLVSVLDYTFPSGTVVYQDLGVTDGLILPGEAPVINITSGSTSGKFRVRVQGFYGNV